MKKTVAVLSVLAVHGLGCAPQPAGEAADAADTVYTNGKIYTVNEAQPWAEAVAIKDGKFLVVGSNADVEAVTGDSTDVVDLGGRFAMPGIQDTHLHFESAYLAGMLEGKMLKFTEEQKSIEDLRKRREEVMAGGGPARIEKIQWLKQRRAERVGR